MRNFITLLLIACFAFIISSCGEDPPPVAVDPGDETNDEVNIPDDNNGGGEQNDKDPEPKPDPDTDPGPVDDDCDTENIGKQCTTDNECGKCIICSGGKCIKGCSDDDDCQMSQGLRCNKQLARCLNVFGSMQACNETKCPTGCCYAERGLQGLKCLQEPSPGVCGLCPQGQVYDGAKCIPAVCSTTTDNCPTLNSHETYPVCWECKSGEFICTEKTGPGGSKCSGVLISATACVPAGQQCVAGVSECCSGMPCVQGYCY